MLEGDRLPEPPGRLPAPFDLHQEKLCLWRLHREYDPLDIHFYPTGKFRFDAPAGEYRALYGNQERLAAFAEVYGDARIIEDGQKERHLSRITSNEELPLVALDDPAVQKRLGLDGRINMSRQYPTTQRWALKLYQWFPQARGIRYLSRHASEERNYCLFLNRCERVLEVECMGKLGELRETVLRAADHYYLEVHWDG